MTPLNAKTVTDLGDRVAVPTYDRSHRGARATLVAWEADRVTVVT